MAPASISSWTGSVVVIACLPSWYIVDAERGECRASGLCRQRFAGAQIAEEDRSALVGKAQILGAHHAQSEAHLRANRIERWVERLLGDGEIGDAHGYDAV